MIGKDIPNSRANDFTSALTWHEWEQAWDHSRHLEVMRMQYLGFFFTALLAVTAFGAHQASTKDIKSSGTVLVIASLALGMHLLSVFVYVAVARINAVLDHYLDVIVEIREHVLTYYSSSDQRPLDLRARNEGVLSPAPGWRGRVILWHATEPVLLLTSVGCSLAITACAGFAFGGMGTGPRLVCASVLGAMIGLDAACWWVMRAAAR